MTDKRNSPSPAAAEIAPEDLDLVVGGATKGTVQPETLSRQEAGNKLTQSPSRGLDGEKGVKKSGV